MATYSELFKDPRWQKKRLAIFERDKFTCTFCKSPDHTLHVHHLYYIKGNDPWDYPDEALKTLCEGCHELEEALKYHDKEFMRTLGIYGYTRIDILLMIANDKPDAVLTISKLING